MLDKLSKGESDVEIAEELFCKMRNEFGEIEKKERKIEQLRMIEQGRRTYNEYVQGSKRKRLQGAVHHQGIQEGIK